MLILFTLERRKEDEEEEEKKKKYNNKVSELVDKEVSRMLTNLM